MEEFICSWCAADLDPAETVTVVQAEDGRLVYLCARCREKAR